MPFMIGVNPVRRTLEYLNRTNLKLKPFVRILAVHYNYKPPNHQGAKEFVHWNVCQLQYQNPDVQVITFRELTPTPFIRVFFDSGRELLMDIDRQSKEAIEERVVRVLCKTKEG